MSVHDMLHRSVTALHAAEEHSALVRYGVSALTYMYTHTPIVSNLLPHIDSLQHTSHPYHTNPAAAHSNGYCVTQQWFDAVTGILQQNQLDSSFLFTSFAHCCYTAVDQCNRSNTPYNQQLYIDTVEQLLGSAWSNELLPAVLAFYLVLTEGNVNSQQHDTANAQELISHVMLQQLYNQYSTLITTAFNNRSIQPSHAVYNTCVEVYIQICTPDSNDTNKLSDADEFNLFVAAMKQQLHTVWTDSLYTSMHEFYTCMKTYESTQLYAVTVSNRQSGSTGAVHEQWLKPITQYNDNKQLYHYSADDTLYDRCNAVMDSVNTLCAHLVTYAYSTSIGKLIHDIMKLIAQTSQLLIPTGGSSDYNQVHMKEYQQLVGKFHDVLQCLRDVAAALLTTPQVQ